MEDFRLLTTEEVSEEFKIPAWRLKKLRTTGGGPSYVKFSNARSAAVRYRPDDVREWLKTIKTKSNTQED